MSVACLVWSSGATDVRRSAGGRTIGGWARGGPSGRIVRSTGSASCRAVRRCWSTVTKSSASSRGVRPAAPEGGPLTEAAGTLLPGLVDCPRAPRRRPAPSRARRGAWSGRWERRPPAVRRGGDTRAWLPRSPAGVTTVRDLGDVAYRTLGHRGPRRRRDCRAVVAAGPPITITARALPLPRRRGRPRRPTHARSRRGRAGQARRRPREGDGQRRLPDAQAATSSGPSSRSPQLRHVRRRLPTAAGLRLVAHTSLQWQAP